MVLVLVSFSFGLVQNTAAIGVDSAEATIGVDSAEAADIPQPIVIGLSNLPGAGSLLGWGATIFNVLPSDAQEEIGKTLFEKFVGPILGYLAGFIVTLEGYILWLLMFFLLKVVNYNNFMGLSAISTGWGLVRDLANLFFILILLAIAIATILRLESYHLKKFLPKLLLMAILVNFSKTICGLVIDVSQVVMMSFVTAFAGANGSANLVATLRIQEIISYASGRGAGAPSAGLDLWGLVGTLVLIVLMLLITIIVILVMLVVFTMRIVMLWFLIVLSPLPYLLAAWPGKRAQSYYQQWWDMFIKYAMIGPVLAFFLWLTFSITTVETDKLLTDFDIGAEGLQNETQTFDPGTIEGLTARLGGGEATNTGGGEAINIAPNNIIGQNPSIFWAFFMAIMMLMGSLIMAQQIGVAGGAFAGSMAGRIRQTGLAALGAPVRGAWRGIKKGTKAGAVLGLESLGAATKTELRPWKWKEGWDVSREKHRKEREAKMRSGEGEGIWGKRSTPAQLFTDYFRLAGDRAFYKTIPAEGARGRRAPARIKEMDAVLKEKEGLEQEMETADFVGRGREAFIEEGVAEAQKDKMKEIEASRESAIKAGPKIKDPKTKKLKDNEEYLKYSTITRTDNKGKSTIVDLTDRLQEKANYLKESSLITGIDFEDKFLRYTSGEESHNPKEAGISSDEREIREAYSEILSAWDQEKLSEFLPEDRLRSRLGQEIDSQMTPTKLDARGRQELGADIQKLETQALELSQGKFNPKQLKERQTELAAKEKERERVYTDGNILYEKQISGTASESEIAKMNDLARILTQIDEDIKRLKVETDENKREPLGEEEKEQVKKENKGLIGQVQAEVTSLKDIAKQPHKTQDEYRQEIQAKQDQADVLRAEAERIRPDINYELRRQQRLAIQEEKKDMTTDSWQELVSILEDANRSGDLNRVGAAMIRLAETANENELFNSFGYASDAKGLKDFTYGQLVGKKGISRDQAKKLGYTDAQYDDFSQGGFSEEQALAVANDVAYTAEKMNHWEVARAVGVKNGRQYFQEPEDRVVEQQAETRKLDFENFLRRANRLAFGYELPKGDTRAERAKNFKATGEREFFNSGFGLAFFRENAEKFDDLLGRGRFNINWAINLVSKTSQSEVRGMLADPNLPPKDKAAMEKTFKSIEGFAGAQQEEDPFADIRDLVGKIKTGEIGGGTRRI